MAPQKEGENNTKQNLWSREMEDELIDMYKASPCLYDSTERGHGDKLVRKRIFEQIASKLGVPGEEVDRRLKSLRTVFTKDLQFQKKMRKKGIREKPVSPRVQMVRNQFKFLLPHIRKSPGQNRPTMDFSDANSEIDSTSSQPEEAENFYDDASDALIDIKPEIPTRYNNYDNPSDPEGWVADPANSFSTAFTSNSDAEMMGTLNPQVIEVAVNQALKEDMVKSGGEDSIRGQSIMNHQRDVLSEGLHLLESMSTTLNNTFNRESEEEDLWCKYLAKKLRRISSQAVRDDLMLHVDGLVNKALRHEWTLPGPSQTNQSEMNLSNMTKSCPSCRSSPVKDKGAKEEQLKDR